MASFTFEGLSGRNNLKSIAVILGSFDPVHKGHEHMVDVCLEKKPGVLLLVPEAHFEKSIVPPLNMTLEQRTEVLKLLFGSNPRVGIGKAKEVLFIKLQKEVEKAFPNCSVHLAFGNDTYVEMRCFSFFFV